MSNISSPHNNRLGDFIRARRKELGMSQKDVKLLGGPSVSIIAALENHKYTYNLTDLTLTLIDAALLWECYSAYDILRGGLPKNNIPGYWAKNLAHIKTIAPQTDIELPSPTLSEPARRPTTAELNIIAQYEALGLALEQYFEQEAPK